jgi:tRNA A-37 threonylcarbamoyl transferase component Bud32
MKGVLELVPGQIFATDFRVVRPLNKGGMGSVYVVEQLSTLQQRALKLMHPELVSDPRLRQRFEQEARIGGQIPSDHIAQVISAGVDTVSGTPWLAMELLHGETLAEWIARRPTSVSELFEIYRQLCHAVGAAHERGIVHRDLKPENVFVSVPRQAGLAFFIKVLDFGIAKISAHHVSGGTTTSMGTPLWMAPEQTENGRIGPPADVWALGLIAFALLTQRTYWARSHEGETTLPALMREILFDPLVPASLRARQLGASIHPDQAFDAWFARCVNRDPAQRFPNASEAYAALVSWVSQPTTAPLASTVSYDAAPPTAVPFPARTPAGAGGPSPTAPAGYAIATERGRLPGVTEGGVSETIHDRPRRRGRTAAVAALGAVTLCGLAAFAWTVLRSGSARAACGVDEIVAADGKCTCPAGSAKAGEHCTPAPLPPCPAGQARVDERGACRCTGGGEPNAQGECPQSACNPAADQAAIRSMLKQAEASAREHCHATSPSANTGTLTVTIATNGHVTGAVIEGPLGDTEAARCVSGTFSRASTTCFNGEPVKLKKNITLP